MPTGIVVIQKKKEEIKMLQNVHQKFTDRQNEVRLFIIEFTINNQRPFHLEDDMEEVFKALQMEAAEYEDIISVLLQKDGMVIDEEKNVNFIYPVSALPTGHRVTLADGRCFTAMCAIDAMGSAFTLHQDTQIDSACAVCGEPIHITIKNGKVETYEPKTLHALTFPLGELENWAGDC